MRQLFLEGNSNKQGRKYRLALRNRTHQKQSKLDERKGMPNYHRENIPGATWFFTVNLLERRNNNFFD